MTSPADTREKTRRCSTGGRSVPASTVSCTAHGDEHIPGAYRWPSPSSADDAADDLLGSSTAAHPRRVLLGAVIRHCMTPPRPLPLSGFREVGSDRDPSTVPDNCPLGSHWAPPVTRGRITKFASSAPAHVHGRGTIKNTNAGRRTTPAPFSSSERQHRRGHHQYGDGYFEITHLELPRMP